jgi:hypothetical protein
MEKVRVLRVIEYVGSKEWVEQQVEQSIHGIKKIKQPHGGGEIRVATIGVYPELLTEIGEHRDKPSV